MVCTTLWLAATALQLDIPSATPPRGLFLHRTILGDYCKIYGLISANSETKWRTGELQPVANRRYHLAGTFKATFAFAVRDDGQRLG